MTQRERLRLEIRALTAEGRFSGWILGLFPVAFAGILYLVQPDYMGFILEETFVVGYGMGDPEYGRNLPYIQGEGK